jgi:hypothetical protein
VHPIHRAGIAAILGLAVIAGLLGLSRTLDLGAATPAKAPIDRAALAQRSHQLDRAAVSLRQALAKKPPALPKVPTYPDAPAAGSGGAPAQAAVQRVTYVRPPPHVVIVPRAGGGEPGDHESGSEHSDD